MATRKTGKVQKKLFGSPYHGATIPMSAGCGSLSFVCREFFGHYTENGKWKSEIVEIDLELGDNIVLGYN